MILLKARNKAEVSATSRTKVFTDFFFKRSLRIFPAYYLILVVTHLLDPVLVPAYSSYLNFTANFAIHANQQFGEFGQLWSMAVEQQFYLLWPLLLLFVPKKFLLHTILLFIVTGVFSQSMITNKEVLVLPQTCFDALGIGVLLG